MPPSRTEQRVYDILDSKRGLIDNSIFLYQGQTPSTVYRYEGFLAGLQVMVADGVAGKRYYLGDDSERGHLYGLANIAAFLGQSMKETIQYDACDENNWDFYFETPLVVYPLVSRMPWDPSFADHWPADLLISDVLGKLKEMWGD